MKIALKNTKVLQFRNDWLYHILEKLQKATLRLLNTPTVSVLI